MSEVQGRAAERARRLMMASLDSELDARGRAELERLLAENPDLEKEWAALRRVKEVTTSMALRSVSDEVWKDYWASVYSQLERGIGWVLLSIGVIVLVGYGVWVGVQELLADASLPWFVKGGILIGSVGTVILLVSVIREKVFLGSRQRYRDIER